jgi:hypothetical protein
MYASRFTRNCRDYIARDEKENGTEVAYRANNDRMSLCYC